MNKLISAALALGMTLTAGAALATPQQDKMKNCNKEAADKKLAGEERKKFMSECLKAKPAEAAAPAAGAKKELPPKEAMGACAKASKEKGNKGDDHKKFMSACLKAKGPANM